MKALLLEKYGEPRICDVSCPIIADDEVLVRVHACAICGSDVHGYDGRSDRRRPPIIMGHEAAGEVAQVGNQVKRYREGDRVVFNSSLFCGTCSYCNHGRQNLCKSSRVFGVHCAGYKLDGAMAEFVAVPERILYHLPKGLDYTLAALAEPFSIALHAVGRTPMGLDETACVIGSGSIGLMLIKALKAAGCTRVAALDINQARLAHARAAGAMLTIDTSEPHWQEDWAKVFPQGVDHSFEAVGAAQTLNNAIDLVKRGGSVTLVGNAAPSGVIDFQKIVLKELLLIGCYACANEYEVALRLMADKKADVSDIVSVTAPLEEGRKWFDILREGKQDVVKVVLTL
ncbi:MAG: galactitol-1-phosphate 5-dehydrogenase [Bacillota bacterium]|nr:galactitol-1-phosphate 5-dehydrogenase [Bacillota bacterium]